MTYISLPEEKDRLLVFYLAMEEYIARYMDVDDAFFMWQTEPTVIFGRNQLIYSEVNIDYCQKKGIKMFRRKSGGGCVYSDRNNVMFSYITKDENVNLTFNRYVNMVALVLCQLGVNAKATGRNDILIDGKKVSGTCFSKVVMFWLTAGWEMPSWRAAPVKLPVSATVRNTLSLKSSNMIRNAYANV